MITHLVLTSGTLVNSLTGEERAISRFHTVEADEDSPCACGHGVRLHNGPCAVFCCGCGEYRSVVKERT